MEHIGDIEEAAALSLAVDTVVIVGTVSVARCCIADIADTVGAVGCSRAVDCKMAGRVLWLDSVSPSAQSCFGWADILSLGSSAPASYFRTDPSSQEV